MATQETSRVRMLEAVYVENTRDLYVLTDNGYISLEELIKQKHTEHREIQVPSVVTVNIAVTASSEEKGTSLSAGPTKLCCYRYGPGYPEICCVVPAYKDCPS